MPLKPQIHDLNKRQSVVPVVRDDILCFEPMNGSNFSTLPFPIPRGIFRICGLAR